MRGEPMPTGRRTSSVVVAVTLALIGLYVAVSSDAVRAATWRLAGGSGTAASVAAVPSRRARPPPRRPAAAATGPPAHGRAVVLDGAARMYPDAPPLLAYPTLAMAVI